MKRDWLIDGMEQRSRGVFKTYRCGELLVGVVFYQLAIIAIMFVVRVTAPGRLFLTAIVLTIFTAVNVFWPPLIVLQLLVVWGGYALLRTSRSG